MNGTLDNRVNEWMETVLGQVHWDLKLSDYNNNYYH